MPLPLLARREVAEVAAGDRALAVRLEGKASVEDVNKALAEVRRCGLHPCVVPVLTVEDGNRALAEVRLDRVGGPALYLT